MPVAEQPPYDVAKIVHVHETGFGRRLWQSLPLQNGLCPSGHGTRGHEGGAAPRPRSLDVRRTVSAPPSGAIHAPGVILIQTDV